MSDRRRDFEDEVAGLQKRKRRLKTRGLKRNRRRRESNRDPRTRA